MALAWRSNADVADPGLGLGSNVERERHLHAGLDALAGFLHDLRCSPVFESEPVGIKSGPFFNLVVSARTDLPLAERACDSSIEADNGRYAPERKGLPLDIDVLFYGDLVGDFDGLVLPRAEVLKNAFVLWPLSELAPNLEHPVARQPLGDLWREARIQQKLWPAPFEWRGQALTRSAASGLSAFFLVGLECGEARTLQRLAQFRALQALFHQRLHADCPRCLRRAEQVGGLRIVALFQAEAAARVHLAGGDELLETLRAAIHVEALQQLQQCIRAQLQRPVGMGVVLAHQARQFLADRAAP